MIMPAQFAWEDINNDEPLIFRDSVEQEPKVSFADKDGILLTVKSSGVEYNRELHPHDSYKKAAERVFQFIEERLLTARAMDSKTPIYDIGLKAWTEYEARHFIITAQGVQHNFNLDNWHWWMIEHLNTLLKTRVK